MANLASKQQEALSYINAIQTILEKYPKIDSLDKLLTNTPAGSITFMTDILRNLGSYDAMVEWISKFLVHTLPAIEMGIKGILLANLKINCDTNPFIPEYLRKAGSKSDSLTPNGEPIYKERGINLSVSSLDYTSILQTSPLSKEGRYNYFGIQRTNKKKVTIDKTNKKSGEVEKKEITVYDYAPIVGLYDLVRAEDFDAFLWFVINKGHQPAPFVWANPGDFNNNLGVNWPEPINLLRPNTVESDGNSSILIQGTTLKKDKSATIAMCINAVRGEDGFIKSSTVVPISDSNISLNWYVNPDNYYNNNLGLQAKQKRNYATDKAICNFEYVKNQTYLFNDEVPIDVGCSDYTLKFTILPKPYILQPLSSIINSQLKIPAPTMILFDEIGNKDTNGNYSIDEDNFDVVQHEEDGKVYFTIHPKEDTNVWVAELHLGRSSFDYELRDGNDGDKLDCLREVYKGLTIYEFNYDFVMGMRLFDSEMIASQLLSGVLGLEFGVNFQLNTEQILIEEQVAHWVKEVLDEEDIELSNCYYTFNNKAYDEANIHAEALKAKGYQINTYPNCVKSINPSLVTNILDELGQVESKIERTEIIKRAINEITATLPQPGTQYAQLQGIKVNFVCNLIEQLMRVLVNTILTPKIVMLIQINEIIMGGNVKDNLSSINLMQFLRKIKNLLVDIIREVANLIISKLFEFVMELLLALFQEAGIYIIKEQMDVYYALIRKMIEECGGIGSLSWGNSIAGSSPFLDIDYADIISNTENNTPIKSDC